MYLYTYIFMLLRNTNCPTKMLPSIQVWGEYYITWSKALVLLFNKVPFNGFSWSNDQRFLNLFSITISFLVYHLNHPSSRLKSILHSIQAYRHPHRSMSHPPRLHDTTLYTSLKKGNHQIIPYFKHFPCIGCIFVWFHPAVTKLEKL